MDYHQLLRDSLTRLPTVAATIDSIRKAVQDRGEIVILYFNFGAYSHVNTRRMMERFARDVMPHFAAQPVTVGV